MNTAALNATYALWDRLAAFPASQTAEALRHLMLWFQETMDADNVMWLASLKMLEEKEGSQRDPLLGWRLRIRRSLVPESEHYLKLVSSYFTTGHYGRLTSSFYSPKDGPGADAHVGMTSRQVVRETGKFRVHQLRDGWIDFARFVQTEHYRLYYQELAIVDRLWIIFPVTDKVESIFLLDRHHGKTGHRKNFTRAQVDWTSHTLRGIPAFHRRLMLHHGVLFGVKAPSPLKLRILQGLLSGKSEKEIALSIEQKPLTMRKYVTELYNEYGVKSRLALMALWLGETPACSSRDESEP